MTSERRWYLREMRLDRTILLSRARANARHARDNWNDDDERWTSLRRSIELLKIKDGAYTRSQMADILPWGMLSPRDDLVLAGVTDPPAPVIQGAIAREASYRRALALLAS